MNNRAILILLAFTIAFASCKKDDSTPAASTVPTYPVSAVVLGPSGAPQGGATLSLQNPPYSSANFTAITDTAGRATIQAPAGAQVLVAAIGTVWRATINVTVQASAAGTNAGSMQLIQNTTLGRTLVIFAGCETLERVLRDTAIAYYSYDSTDVYTMRTRATTDSVALLTYLQQYSLVFSDCNCGDESGYPLLARIYGRYVQGGGKIYGGHYNYMNLQYIFAPNYQTSTSNANDSLTIIDNNLRVALGYSVIRWPGSTGYEKYTDLPSGSSTVYAVFTNTPGSTTSPQGVPVIIENRLGTGKYLWTIYHNQDILSDARLVRIVRYFLYSL
jgi:hypothetical protein